MFGFDALIDQHRPVRLLTAALETGNLPNAYLFSGPTGVGKKTAAQAFAMVCNCQNTSDSGSRTAAGKASGAGDHMHSPPAFCCGRCRSCRKISSNNHPDVHWILPSGNYIKVDQIRKLCQRLSLKPYEAKTRLVIIAEAHMLNPEAGNTLLKVLEDPPEKTLFILTARQASDLLPTILSRCRHIRFNPISRENIKRYLEVHCEVAPKDADIVAAMADGSLSNAMAMVEKDWITHRHWVIKTLTTLDKQSINYQLAFSDFLAKSGSRVETTLDIIRSWYRDLAVSAYMPEQLINKDLSDEIVKRSKQFSMARLLDISRKIEDTARRIQANTNIRLAMDSLIIALSIKENNKNGENHRHPV